MQAVAGSTGLARHLSAWWLDCWDWDSLWPLLVS